MPLSARSRTQNRPDGGPARGILFPTETWRMIFDILLDEETNHRQDSFYSQSLLVLARTSRAFQPEAERILYLRVTLANGPDKLDSFALALKRRPSRAGLVRHLSLALRPKTAVSLFWRPPARSEGTARQILGRLVNLVELQVQGLQNPRVVLADPIPFRLRSLLVDGVSVFSLHSPEGVIPSESENANESGSLAAPIPLALLASLTALQLVEPIPVDHTLHICRYCAYYANITHFSLEIERLGPLGSDTSMFGYLSAQLVSFRLRVGPVPRYDAGWWADPACWPGKLVSGHSFPRLKYLELYEDPTGPNDVQYSRLMMHFAKGPGARFSITKEGSACPRIETVVWHPRPIHRTWAREDSAYREDVQDFTESLFEVWKSLGRFERPMLERHGAAEAGEEGDGDAWAAYVRMEDVVVMPSPATYDDQAWRRA